MDNLLKRAQERAVYLYSLDGGFISKLDQSDIIATVYMTIADFERVKTCELAYYEVNNGGISRELEAIYGVAVMEILTLLGASLSDEERVDKFQSLSSGVKLFSVEESILQKYLERTAHLVKYK